VHRQPKFGEVFVNNLEFVINVILVGPYKSIIVNITGPNHITGGVDNNPGPFVLDDFKRTHNFRHAFGNDKLTNMKGPTPAHGQNTQTWKKQFVV